MGLGLGLLGAAASFAQSAERGRVEIPSKFSARVEVVRTEVERAQGLAGRRELRPDEGMLFVYERPSRPTFWMRGMVIPIDILWVRDGRVVGMVRWALPPQPGGAVATFQPPVPVDAVLEVAAGTVDRTGIAAGDPVVVQLGR